MIELTGERMPRALLARLESAGTDEAQYAVGVDHATALSRELLTGGATGLHLYTFNKHQAVLSVLGEVGLFTPTKEHA
jgi:methylenetetrahydrofolate reductase (NADPH)